MKKSRYLIYIRRKNRGGKVWWCEDTETGKQESLGTREEKEAQRIPERSDSRHVIVADQPEAIDRFFGTGSKNAHLIQVSSASRHRLSAEIQTLPRNRRKS